MTLFGSLASGTHDGWSDIDMMCATTGPAVAWEAARLLRDALPWRWYGPFSDLPQPSGRYWPLGESIFHSVDLSFRTLEAHARVLDGGLRGFKVVAHDLLWREGLASREGEAGASVTPGDYAFTHTLYVAVKAMKDYLRSQGDWVTVSARMDALEVEARALPRRPAAGRPDDVLDEARSLYKRLLMDRLRAGV